MGGNKAMTLPNFLIVGAMKAGTTWLAINLKQHPQVFMPDREIHFFNHPENYQRGVEWYDQQLAGAGNAIAIGEKTAGYLLDQKTPSRIHEFLPDTKIIIVLREPVARAISQINHHIRSGEVNPNIAVDNFMESPEFRGIDRKFKILERGHYLKQIKRYYQFFDPKNILIIINETDIKKKPKKTLQKACEFLGIDPAFNFPKSGKQIHQNMNSKVGASIAYHLPVIRSLIIKVDRFIPMNKTSPFELSLEEKYKFHQVYEKDNQKLFEFLGRELPQEWCKSPTPTAQL